MQDLGYWIDTFLSKPTEVATLLLTLVVFAVAAISYSDEKDNIAVAVGVIFLAGALGIFGPSVGVEWHYWLGGGVLAAAAIILVDT